MAHYINIKKFLKEQVSQTIDIFITNQSKQQINIMLNIKGTSQNNLQCYLLQIRSKYFLFVNKPNLQNLKYFSLKYKSNQTGRDEKKNKQDSRYNQIEANQKIKQEKLQERQQTHTLKQQIGQQDYSKLKVHFDLNYLRDIFNKLQKLSDKTAIFIMLTHYQDFIVLPYIFRKFKGKHDIQIYTTHIMCEMGRIYMKQFYQRICNFDMLNTQPKELSFQQQSRIEDSLYINHGVQISTWTKLFTKQQMGGVLALIFRMNYGQINDVDGVSFRPYPSGHSLGSAFWLFQNALTKQNILFIKQFSTQKWRAISQNYLLSCQKSAQKFRLTQIKNIDILILANSSLISHNNYVKSAPDQCNALHSNPSNADKQGADYEVMRVMRNIKQNMQKNLNTDVVLEDQLLILDIIEHINFELKQKFKSVFIQNKEYNQIISYSNSFVQFLTNNYKQRIYKDPPEYPFEGYLSLRHKGQLSTGTLFQIAQKHKIPLKQLVNRFTPYINFKSDYSSYLQNNLKPNQTATQISTIQYNQKDYFSQQNLNKMIQFLRPSKIISYTNILPYCEASLSQNIAILQYNKQYSINSQPYHYYQSKNISSNIINKYQFQDGYILAYPVNRQFLRLDSSWKVQIQKRIKQSYRKAIQITQKGIKTMNTQIEVRQYQFFIRSQDIRQLILILQILSSITRTIRLK